MSINLDRLERTLEHGRTAAGARMLSAVKVRRRTGRTTQNEDTGEQVPIWDIVHTDLPFRLDGSSNSDGGSHTVTIGGVAYEQATGVGHFPFDAEDFADGDYVEVTAGEWAGGVYSIVAAIKGDQKTARRLPIAEQPRPTEWDA